MKAKLIQSLPRTTRQRMCQRREKKKKKPTWQDHVLPCNLTAAIGTGEKCKQKTFSYQFQNRRSEANKSAEKNPKTRILRYFTLKEKQKKSNKKQSFSFKVPPYVLSQIPNLSIAKTIHNFTMSWLFKSFQSDGPDSSESQQTSSPERSPSATPRGVKDDLSLLGQTLGRQLRGVADFLAPPPPPATAAAVDSFDHSSSSSSSSSSQSEPQPQPLLGIRNDLVEIGGSFRAGLSLLSGNKAVSEISRLASNLLQFESDGVRDEVASGEEDDDDRIDEGVPGVTDEVLDFASDISTRHELWTDFPLPLDNGILNQFLLVVKHFNYRSLIQF
jgi:hypothetical protein